ncbi:MAG: nucleotide exchange factor GrpE [Planctomycetaceae bacterium]
MPTWTETEETLRAFREWLNHTADEIAALPDPRDAADEDLRGFTAANSTQPSEAPEAGLLQLVEAFTAMRHELKLQTKSTRGLETTVEHALEGLNSASRTFQSVQAQERDAARRAAKPLIEALAGLDEGLQRASLAFDAARHRLLDAAPEQIRNSLAREFSRLPWWRRLLVRKWHAVIADLAVKEMRQSLHENVNAIVQGFDLLRSRLSKSLAELQITRIDQPGGRVDPNLMTVVELVTDPALEPETVVRILRPGYVAGDQVIRFAEVKAVASRQRAPDVPEQVRDGDFDTPVESSPTDSSPADAHSPDTAPSDS